MTNSEVEEKIWYNSARRSVRNQIDLLGEDPDREGLRGTPDRVVKSWGELHSGYQQDPSEILRTFSTDGYDQMVLLKGSEFFSMCEHHMLPFYGTAHVAYIPNDRVIGISKLARLLDIFCRRLQIQERICEQVTWALMNYLEPAGAACILEGVHMCMRMRGCSKHDSTMITSSLKGDFLKESSARMELFQLISK